MNAKGAALAREALGLVGTSFRLHGRSALGVDCVGLVAVAAWRAGYEGAAPERYAMRGSRIEQCQTWLRAAGLECVQSMRLGDVILAEAGARQFHLMVFTGTGFVHAHAGLRRVVEMPGDSPWPVKSIWRIA